VPVIPQSFIIPLGVIVFTNKVIGYASRYDGQTRYWAIEKNILTVSFPVLETIHAVGSLSKFLFWH
jgi:hypothetical protein